MRRLTESEDPEALEIANSLRVLLFSWLTVPVIFDRSILESLQAFGSVASFESRWGLQGEYKAALAAAESMIREGNPLRDELLGIIRQLNCENRKFKIFCHRKARQHFESLIQPAAEALLDDSHFLHSVRDYANAEPFGVLIKVGPLRSTGWGAAPDSIRSAPRFEILIQLVWSGCADEPSFGYDPVEPPSVTGTVGSTSAHDALSSKVPWNKHIERKGFDPGPSQKYFPEQDEFAMFSEPKQQGARRRATLLEIPEGDGILYPRTAEVLTFDPRSSESESIAFRVIGQSFFEGMYVVHTQLGEIEFGGPHASESGYCRIWKQVLRDELDTNADAFCHILRTKGVDLQSLPLCVANWAEPPHTVIHAPQKWRHFQILIAALPIDPAITAPRGSETRAWWQRAWDEVRASRGEAIQTGKQEQEIIGQQALDLLRSLLPEIRLRSSASEGFRIQIPEGWDLRGGFVFLKVLRMEEGYLAPETELKIVRDLDTLEQWKVA